VRNLGDCLDPRERLRRDGVDIRFWLILMVLKLNNWVYFKS
jgi:hypothetical protein